MVEGSGCGLCVDPTDPEAIAAALTYLAEHPEQRAAMGANGRRAVFKTTGRLKEGALLEAYAKLAHPSV